MTQTNDYSFNSSDGGFTANPHITVYAGGTLIYGPSRNRLTGRPCDGGRLPRL